MGQRSGQTKEPAKQVITTVHRATRMQYSAEEKIRIVLAGLRGEDNIAERLKEFGLRSPLNEADSLRVIEQMAYIGFMSLVFGSQSAVTDSRGATRADNISWHTLRDR